jgi:surface antigen
MSTRQTIVRLILAGILVASIPGCTMPQDSNPALYATLGETDLVTAASTVQQTLESAPDGSMRHWANPLSGHAGTVRPVATYVSEDGRFCRQYEEELQVGEGQGSYRHLACREDDGYWVWQ